MPSVLKIKVVFLIDSLQTGGTEKSLVTLATSFNKVTPIFISLFEKNDFQQELINNGIEFYSLNLKKTYFFHNLVKPVCYLLREINPDIIHSSLFYADMVSRRLNMGIPIINSLVSNSYSQMRFKGLKFSLKLKLRVIKFMDFFYSHKVDLFFANSETIKEHYSKALRINCDKIKVIYRGREILELRDKKNETEDKIFLFVGRLIESKGIHELIKAFSEINRDKIKLLIVGEGPFRSELEKLISRLNLGSNIQLLGSQQNVNKFFEKADYFVFPSHFEGLPGALIEAMMAKVPIIASDIPENKECLTSDMALFHQVHNPTDLAIQLKAALNLSDWTTRTTLAHAFACEHFNIDKIAQAYEETYSELIRRLRE